MRERGRIFTRQSDGNTKEQLGKLDCETKIGNMRISLHSCVYNGVSAAPPKRHSEMLNPRVLMPERKVLIKRAR